MPRFLPEPAYQHGSIAKVGILLVNLGTPDAPTRAAVRRYLAQFLSDRRVVELPRMAWLALLHGIILNVRPARSARKYARIWSPEGSPLKVHSEKQARLLRGYLGMSIRSPLAVEYAMRYGEPSIPAVLAQLKTGGCERVLVVPLFPQYSASATASVFDELAGCMALTRNVPELRWIKHFHDHPAYIRALADSVREHWRSAGRPALLLMSFHGTPQASLERGDPYHCECRKTARLLAAELELADAHWQISFQSRFGAAQWLKPYTAATLAELARRGVRRVDVVCPGFVSDCLETLEEIGIEGKQLFLSAGGKEFHLLPCLNERDDWIRALGAICLGHLGGWVSEAWDAERARQQAAESRKRAQSLGARD